MTNFNPAGLQEYSPVLKKAFENQYNQYGNLYNQYANQYGNQYGNEYPNEYGNQYGNRYPNQYTNTPYDPYSSSEYGEDNEYPLYTPPSPSPYAPYGPSYATPSLSYYQSTSKPYGYTRTTTNITPTQTYYQASDTTIPV